MFWRIGRRSLRLQQLAVMRQQVKYNSGSAAKLNTVILFVPQQECWIIERFGKYCKSLDPGFNVIFPIIDKVKYVQVLKELPIEIPHQAAITADNVTLSMDGVLYLKIFDPYKTSYGVESPEFAITQLAQTTMRSEIGKISLDTVFRERESLNVAIVDALNKAAEEWGMKVLRYEIKDITLPNKIKEAMQMQVEADRKKRANVLESEGVKLSAINIAEGEKKARILTSEAFKIEQINQAEGEARGLLTRAEAKARSVEVVAKALSQKNGMNAVSYNVAEQYVDAFSNLAKKGNTVILPSNTGDVTGMVAQAMAIYRNLSHPDQALSDDDKPVPHSIPDVSKVDDDKLNAPVVDVNKLDASVDDDDKPDVPVDDDKTDALADDDEKLDASKDVKDRVDNDTHKS